jgi:molecular chaperone GrpE
MNTTSSHSTPPEDDAARALATDFESLEAEVARQKDLYLRLAADFDNFRKRTAQEADRRAAAQKDAFIRELLPIIDNLERALAPGNVSTSQEKLCQGVQMTLQQLQQLLRRHGIEPEDSLGQPFDPNRHEALRSRRDPSKPDHTVLEVFQRGYCRGKEVIRPAKVAVNDLAEPAPENRPSEKTPAVEIPVHHHNGKNAKPASER